MKRAVIIGAGVGGLTAAIYCLMAGMSVEIFEKSDTVGGNLTGWDREGCRIDNCLHWLVGTNEQSPMNKMWQEVGMLDGNDTVKLPYFYRSEKNGESVSFYRDLEKARREFLRVSPIDRRETEKFFSAVRFAAAKTDRRPISRSEKIKGGLNFALYSRMSLKDVSKRFRSPLLCSAFCDLIDGEFNALGLILSYAEFCADNADIPCGGSVAASLRMARTVRQNGGVIHLKNPVRKISVSVDKATGIIDRNGEFFPADVVIAACDPSVTFSQLLNKGYCPEKLKKLYKSPRYPVFSAVSAAYEVDADKVDFTGSTVFDCKPFYTDGKRRERLMLRAYNYEPSFAPSGKTVLQCMITARRSSAERWIRLKSRGEEYKAQKEKVSEIIRSRIAERLCVPVESVKPLDVWTPASYNSRFQGYCGAFMSFAVTKSSLLPRVPMRISGLTNVILTGQWLSPVGGVLNAARFGFKAAKLAVKLSGAKREQSVKNRQSAIDF